MNNTFHGMRYTQLVGVTHWWNENTPGITSGASSSARPRPAMTGLQGGSSPRFAQVSQKSTKTFDILPAGYTSQHPDDLLRTQSLIVPAAGNAILIASLKKKGEEMVYVTVRQSPQYHQMTIDEFLDSSYIPKAPKLNKGATRTYKRKFLTETFVNMFDYGALIEELEAFNKATEKLRKADRHSLYKSYKIPKSSGGWRQIDEPRDELKTALTLLKDLFERSFGALHHTNAYAYAKGRCTIDAVKCHQHNASRWFVKFDMKDFFGSTTPEFVLKQLKMVFPFSHIMMSEKGRRELTTALDLAFLDGGLPQGSPTSPLLTNIMMIPIDYELTKRLRDDESHNFVYTRYADDIIISSRYDFRFTEIAAMIRDILNSFEAPFDLNNKKTRYGSSSGANWNLGVMLNKDNKITIGRKKKEQFIRMLGSYAMAKKSGGSWILDDLYYLQGIYSYYCEVEGKTAIDNIVEYVGRKHGLNIMKSIKQDLKS